MRFLLIPFYCVLLISCKKDGVIPDEIGYQQELHAYEVKEVTYFMSEGDAVDTIVVQLPGFEVANTAATIMEREIKVGDYDLTKQSEFILDESNHIPDGMILDTFKINVPANMFNEASFSLSADKFPFVSGMKEIPFTYPVENVLNINIPAVSKILVNTAIDQYILLCSFRTVFRNKHTGHEFTITGKWKGTLRYNNLSLVVDEETLSR